MIKEQAFDKDGKETTARDLNWKEVPPGVDLTGPRGLAGSVAASAVLSAGGTIQDALDAAIKARNAEKAADQSRPPMDIGVPPPNPDLEDMIRYIHAIARLHSGRFDELTIQGMFEVAMLCPYPVEPYETWLEKMNVLRGTNG
jgi:hypothetical protein